MFNNKSMHRQRGVTAIGWLIILSLIAFFTLLALRIVPMYLEYYSAESILEKVASEPDIKTMRKHDIDSKITSLLDINSMTNVKPEYYVVDKKADGMTITLEYEVRAPMFKEIGIYGHFKKTKKVGAN